LFTRWRIQPGDCIFARILFRIPQGCPHYKLAFELLFVNKDFKVVMGDMSDAGFHQLFRLNWESDLIQLLNGITRSPP